MTVLVPITPARADELLNLLLNAEVHGHPDADGVVLDEHAKVYAHIRKILIGSLEPQELA